MSVKYFFPFLIFLACWSCAQQGSPTGGPRDEDPPVILESEPPNYSIRFEAKKVLITFDEYIVLDNVNQELIVSPPMEEKPEVKLRKRSLIIEFEEDLKANTTYTFNFGSAIKDLHEGNVLLNYEYVFSTGDVLDSLSVKGTLKYAHDLSVPEEPISILLYNDLRDSVPLTDIPLYVGRSDDSGVFSVNNLRADVYKVFALKDGNNNFLFDLPTEEIAFLDTSLIVNAEFARLLLQSAGLIDSIPAVALVSPEDTLMNDSIPMAADSIADTGPDLNSIYIDLELFTEEADIQYISDYNRDDRRRLQVVFARPLSDTFQYHTLPVDAPGTIDYLEYFSPERDSLTLWIRDSVHYKLDTLHLQLNFTAKDSSMRYVMQTDTLRFTYREKKTGNKRKTAKENQPEKLEIHTIRKGGSQELHRDLALNLNLPLQEISDSLIELYHNPDSVEVEVPFSTRRDSLLPNRAWISSSWNSAAQYRLRILPGAITSIYPPAHDTIDVSFSTRDSEYYGQILLSMENVKTHTIIQLLSRDKVLMERSVDADGMYTFSNLVPQEYTLKFIHDINGNGKWDTGNYLKKQQPEPVEMLPVDISVRSNWDHDVTMKLEK
ncbi:MAG: Ig-like domain-containing protein [Bacteroidota bacterium]